jgi:hypothetical protein
MVISWSAEKIGPRIIAAPQRGHAHVATVGVSVAVDGVTTLGRAAPRSSWTMPGRCSAMSL